MKKWMKKHGLTLLTIFFLCGLMFFYIDKKQGFHEDEIFSYGSSNYKYDNVYRNYGYAQANMDFFWNNIWSGSLTHKIAASIDFWFHQDNYKQDYNKTLEKEEPTWKNRTEAKEYLTISNKSDIFNFFSIWLNQTLDVHPPMFYNLVHIYSTLFYNHFSKYIIFYLNLTCFILTLIGISKIMTILQKEKWKLPTLILYGASIGAISTVMFQRMYMMMTTFGIWYLYYNLKYFKSQNWRKIDSFLYGLIIFLGFLTQYYFCIYVVFTFIITSILLIKQKEYKKWRKLLYIHSGAAILGILLFPACIDDIFFSYRGIGGASNRTKSTLEMLLYFSKALIESFSIPTVLALILLISLIVILIKNKKIIHSELFILTIPIPLFLLIVSKISPFLGEDYTSRYIMLVYPIIAICICYILSYISKKHTEKIFLTIIILLSIYGLSNNTPTYLYQDYQKVMNLAEENKENYLIYIYDNYFTHLNSLPEFTIYQKHLIINYNIYDFTNLQKDLELNNQKEVIVCIKNWLNTEKLLQDILDNTQFTTSEILLDLHSDVESTYYRLSKK